MSFETGTDSPVRAASSALSAFCETILASAGTISPASSRIMSPETSSVLLICEMMPSLFTLENGVVISLSESIAFSAFVS